MQTAFPQHLTTALQNLWTQFSRLAELLQLPDAEAVTAFGTLVKKKWMPRFAPDSPVAAAVCGGGSSGKSALFNALMGQSVSPVGGYAGLNRRVLFGAHPVCLARQDFLQALFEPFGCIPEPLKRPEDLQIPGCPLYTAGAELPPSVLLLDTPDFDTGARGCYTNRDAARQALESADLLIYIFTNANYHNRDNTDFIAEMLTRIGVRKSFLVYRVYPSFTQDEVLNHAMTVAGHLYGEDAGQHVLGVYRADEDNAVAAGEKLLTLHPVPPEKPPLLTALERIDPRRQRLELFASMLADTVNTAEHLRGEIRTASEELRLYLNGLQAAQSLCVKEALQHFPADRVLRRFAEIWQQTDPTHIKAMRKVGAVVEFPLKAGAAVVRWTRSRLDTGGRRPPQPAEHAVEDDLLKALHELYVMAIDRRLSVELPAKDPVGRDMLAAVRDVLQARGTADRAPQVEDGRRPGLLRFYIDAHPVVGRAREQLRQRDWQQVLDAMRRQKDVIFSVTENIDAELRRLADNFRSRMDFWSRLGQTFSAALNVLPATAAVTYILATGDPVGGAGIKIKLAGLFGAKDLYALVAIPVTTGLKKADLKQLELILGPVAKTWLDHQLQMVQAFFERQITAELLSDGKAALAEVQKTMARIEADLAVCQTAVNLK